MAADKLEVEQLFAECIGTYIFFMCILQSSDPLPVVIGLLAAIYIFGKVSGGFFNSTLTIVMYLKGTIDAVKMFAYIVAQIVGGALALATWKILNNK
jgi:glycerol uptake facilitator-like aquaporin